MRNDPVAAVRTFLRILVHIISARWAGHQVIFRVVGVKVLLLWQIAIIVLEFVN